LDDTDLEVAEIAKKIRDGVLCNGEFGPYKGRRKAERALKKRRSS
jgi:hypothetical protein